MTETTRKPRESETRAATEHVRSWRPPDHLPMPEPRPGLEFRYIRTSTRGQADLLNVSRRVREGWKPVLAKDYPELMTMSDIGSRFPENIEIGGLLLCVNATETMQQRRDYQAEKTAREIKGVDEHYLRQSDPRMPVLRPERTSRVSTSWE